MCSGLNWTPEPQDCSDQGLPIPAPQQVSMRVLGSRSNSWAGTWLSKGQGAWLLSTYKTTYSKLYQKPRDSEYSEHCLFIFTCWAPAQVPGMSVETQSVVNAFCQIQNLYKQKSDNLISVLKMHYAMTSHFPPSESQSPDLDSLALAASLAVLPTPPSLLPPPDPLLYTFSDRGQVTLHGLFLRLGLSFYVCKRPPLLFQDFSQMSTFHKVIPTALLKTCSPFPGP